MTKQLVVPTRGSEMDDLSTEELQLLFNELDAHVKLSEPQLLSMKRTYEEAKMLFDDMKYKRGRAAFLLTIRKKARQ